MFFYGFDFMYRILFFLLLFLFFSCNLSRDDFVKTEEKEFVNCDFKNNKVCNFSKIKKDEILFRGTLDLNPKPVVSMKEITFTLVLDYQKFTPEEILLDLTMPEMYMGDNKVRLTKKQDNIYEGKGIFPECTSKFTKWNIEVFFDQYTSTNVQFDILK